MQQKKIGFLPLHPTIGVGVRYVKVLFYPLDLLVEAHNSHQLISQFVKKTMVLIQNKMCKKLVFNFHNFNIDAPSSFLMDSLQVQR
jgi:hypothetical protein